MCVCDGLSCMVRDCVRRSCGWEANVLMTKRIAYKRCIQRCARTHTHLPSKLILVLLHAGPNLGPLLLQLLLLLIPDLLPFLWGQGTEGVCMPFKGCSDAAKMGVSV